MDDKSIFIISIVAAVFVAALLAWILTRTIVSLRWKGKYDLLRFKLEDCEKDAAEKLAEEKKDSAEKLADERRHHEEMKKLQEEAVRQQVEAVRAEMTVRTEEILKAREEELARKAAETFGTISGDLGKDLKAMKEAFEAGKKAQAEDSATMKEKFDAAVKSLEAQSREIGGKADHLADALRGQKKMQGCWGETVLANLLTVEGLQEGRDYDKEETLRDELGFVIVNEDSEKKMRPDYILHLQQNNDIIIDAKVSLAAYVDYVEAETAAAKADASKRNCAAVKEQVKKLSDKNYSNYLLPGHKMLDYVLMFVPNYPALQLAYDEDPGLWRDAYSKGVLITSEETLMPFLRMIAIAWTNVEQVKNQQKIIAAAQNMIDRVADFSVAHAEMGKKLEDACKEYDKCSSKLKDSGQSIVQSARQVMKLGVPMSPKKSLPE